MRNDEPLRRGRRANELANCYATLLKEQAESGLSMREFAVEAGVSAWTLYSWKRRLSVSSGAPVPSDPELVAVEVVGGRKAIRAGMGGYELALPNGARLRVPRDFDAARVSELLAVLRAC